MSVCRGIRGATTVDSNDPKDILSATKDLLEQIMEANQIISSQLAAGFFTTTKDLNSAFPAKAARELGWEHVALICGHEMDVPDSLHRCVRVLLLVNTDKNAEELVHVYLRESKKLRSEEIDA